MKYLIFFLFVVLTCAEMENSDLSNIKDLAKNLPANFSVSNLPGSLDEIPEGVVENVGKTLKEKCMKTGGEAAFIKAQDAQPKMIECIQGLVNVTQMQNEIEEAKPKGSLDTVFHSYCAKAPEVRKCITDFTAAAEDCLEPQEKESVKVAQNITDSLLDFICFKEGDRIALFIAEGGQDCLNKTQTEISQCMNSTFGKHVPNNTSTIETFPSFILGEKECGSLGELQKCVVQQLENKCDEPTPANIIDSMFKFVVKMSPCAQYLKANNTASMFSLSLGSALLSAAGALILTL